MGYTNKISGRMLVQEGYADKYGNCIRTAKVTLTAAQILLSNTTPIQLIAAPGANKFSVIEKVIAALDYSGGAFSNVALEFRETNASGTKVAADVSSFLNVAADIIRETSGIEAITTRLLNKAIVVCGASNPTGAAATSTVTITVFYRECRPYVT